MRKAKFIEDCRCYHLISGNHFNRQCQELFEDGLHPSAAGYALWRQEVEPIFRKVVGR